MNDDIKNILPEDEEVVEIVHASKKKRRSLFFRLLRLLFRTTFLLVLLLFSLRLIVGINYVQNKLVAFATSSLSKKLETRVEIDYVKLVFFDHFDIQGVYIQDFHQDTLLFTQSIHANIKLFSLFNRKVVVEELTFDNTRFNFYRYPEQYYPEIQNLIIKLSKPYEPGPPKDNPTFYLDCEEMIFYNLRFGFQNAYNGDKLIVTLKDLALNIGKADFYNKTLDINSIVLNEPKAEFLKALAYDIPESAFPKPNPADTIVYPIDTAQAQFWTITVAEILMTNGSFEFDNLRVKNFFDLEIDVQHFNLEAVYLKAKDFKLANQKATWKMVEGNLHEKRGFALKSFKADMMMRVDTLAFYNLELVTPESILGDTLIFAYSHISDMGYFVDKVKLDIRSKNSIIAIKDLLKFAPQLNKNAFFRQNKEGKLILKGRIYDRVNRLRGDDLYISIGQNATIKGSFKSRNFTNPELTFLQLKIDRLNTNMRNLKLLFPDMNISEQFFKLGKIDFKGNFDGFYYDFVAAGNLRTELGRAEMSINLKTPTKAARYSGTLNLYEFNLKEWTDNPDFGTVTFKSTVKGTGGSLETLDIKIDADIESFAYKAYPYENIIIDGNFKQKSFTGEMGITDGNIDLTFNGEMNFNDPLPKFDLVSNITHVNLNALNFTKDTFTFNTRLNLNFSGDDLDNIVGTASISDLNISTGSENFRVDSMVLRSSIKNRYRMMTLNSEILNASLGGNYTIKNIEKPFLNFVAERYPSFAQKINIKFDSTYVNKEFAGTENFIFNAKVFDTKNITHLLDAGLDTIRNLTVKANFNAVNESFSFKLGLPYFAYNQVQINEIKAHSNGISDKGKFVIEVKETKIGNLIIPKITLENGLSKDTITFKTSVSSITDIFSALNINGQLFLTDNQFQVHLDSSDLFISEDKWMISDNNYIQFGSGYIHTNNFILKNNDQSIALNSIGEKGLQLNVNNLPMSLLQRFITIPFLTFDGKMNVETKVKNLFNFDKDSISSTVHVDTFYMNGSYFGALDISAFVPRFDEPLNFQLDLEKKVLNDENITESQSLTVGGKYYLPTPQGIKKYKPNVFAFSARTKNFPFKVIEYFVQGISGTKGKVNADLFFSGDIKKPEAKGTVRLYEAGTKVDFLQTFYRLEEVKVVAKNNFFDFSGNELMDKFGNKATVIGGINHKNLKNFELALSIFSPEFLLIDTEKKDSELFYGRGIGAAKVDFSGPMASPNIDINATTSRDSWMSIPLMSSSSAKAVNFIEFVNPKDTVSENKKNVNFLGANLKLELNVTPQAEISLIFDESVGDIMRGRGKGNLTINVTNKGEFTMFGTYELTSGEYLFTYSPGSGVSINKPFTVAKGGTIAWDGDPFTAQINIDAIYKGLRTAPYNLILEYLVTDEEKTLAQRATDVDLMMQLRGDLMAPEIGFDIQFPNVSQRLVPYVENKMRTVKADKNELNRQVFGLIVLKSFLPNETGISLNTGLQTYANTMTEMISNQLSLYVTGLVSEIVTDLDFVSGVDFNFNYQPFAEVATDPSLANGVTSELQVNTQSQVSLFNQNFVVGAGGGVNSVSSGTYFTGDFVVEYVVSDDGRLRLKAYNRSDPDINGNRNKSGIGVTYSLEFNTFKREKPKPLQVIQETENQSFDN
jgi:hypothetical protein